ncbi:MAG: hypothetical protein ACJ79H_14180 [Myxococcales bacterium]
MTDLPRPCAGTLRAAADRRHAWSALIATLWLGLGQAAAGSEPSDTRTIVPGARYDAGWLSRLVLGEQWRDLWTTPIEVPVLDLKTFDGGLRPQRRGGGLQTSNIHLKSGNERTWVFRSVDKDATGLLDAETRASVLGDIVQDLTSTVHPGAALVVAPLLEAAGILHATPQLAIMPDDPALGEFRQSFAGMLGLLEQRIEDDVEGADEIADTLHLFVRLEKGREEEIDAANYLRARLVDLLVGDWDRHLDQWRWVGFAEGYRHVWRPIPRDRDQAFSRFGGAIPALAEYYTKQLASFHQKYPAIDKLTFSGRFTDRRFLVWLGEQDWESVTADVVARLTDAVIADAVRHLPAAMYAKGGAELERVLRARRDGLADASHECYRMLAGEVDLRAAEGETIIARRGSGGTVEVTTPRFHRTFVPDETNELRLYTPRGGRVLVEGNEGDVAVRTVPADPRDPEPTRERYETFRDWGRDLLFFPVLSYDSTRGVVPGARAQLTRYGFGLDPFSSQQSFAAAWATMVNRARLEYGGEFRTRSPLSVLTYLSYTGIDIVSFFGPGNESVRDPALAAAGFYSVRQEHLTVLPGLQATLVGSLRAHLGAVLEHVSSAGNGATAASGLYGSAGMTLGSGEVGLTLDTVSGALTARRGFRLRITARHTPAVFDSSSAFSKVRAAAAGAFGGTLLTDVFVDLQIAAEKNWGRYPFFESAFLGGSAVASPLNLTGASAGSALRGYDANRFAGDASVAGNLELRGALGRFLALLPFRYGVVGIADVGRVFLAGETSSRWHTGVGGGLWLAVSAAAQTFELTSSFNALVVRSDEGTAFYLSTGYGF